MDYMDPDVLCPQKADKVNLSLSLSYVWVRLYMVYFDSFINLIGVR